MPSQTPNVQAMLLQLRDFGALSLALASNALSTAMAPISALANDEPTKMSAEHQLSQLFARGYCAWPACDAQCDSNGSFLQHLETAHVLANRRTATGIKLQAEIIEQLLCRLVKECQKLEAMKNHLAFVSAENRYSFSDNNEQLSCNMQILPSASTKFSKPEKECPQNVIELLQPLTETYKRRKQQATVFDEHQQKSGHQIPWLKMTRGRPRKYWRNTLHKKSNPNGKKKNSSRHSKSTVIPLHATVKSPLAALTPVSGYIYATESQLSEDMPISSYDSSTPTSSITEILSPSPIRTIIEPKNLGVNSCISHATAASAIQKHVLNKNDPLQERKNCHSSVVRQSVIRSVGTATAKSWPTTNSGFQYT